MNPQLDIINTLDDKFDIQDDLTPNQRRFILISKFDREIQYGGFDQFYYSEYGAFFKETADALNHVGAFAVARILAEANSLWPTEIPMDRDERIDAIDQLPTLIKERFIDLDAKYTTTTDNLVDLLYAFINGNPNDFS